MHTTPQWNGNVSVQELPSEFGWSPTNGFYTARKWKGTQAEIENILPGLKASGYEYKVIKGPMWLLTANIAQETDEGDPVPEVPIPIFSLVSQRVDKNLIESDCPFIKSLQPSTIAAIRDSFRDDAGPGFLTGSLGASAAEKAQAADVYVHMLAGVNTYTLYVPVLRKTYTVSNQYIVNESMTVNKVYSTPTLISYENIPPMMLNILPSSGTTSNIVPNPAGLDTTVSVPANWGWLKGSPQYEQVGETQFQVTVDYEYNLWAQKVYGTLL